MLFLSYLILGIYSAALLYITGYCLLQFNLLYHYRKAEQPVSPCTEKMDADATWPVVTVQLPIFNERYVVDRLIDRICQLDYPKDRLEIQVLDDSTDDTVEMSRKKVNEYRAKGFDISLHHRTDRTGYKAGALKAATRVAKGEFIAIFDADFLPRLDFLRRTVPHFQDEKVGVVQTRWEHINEEYSIITRLQALQLNVHFTVEQKGRQAGDYLLQFNGTAGVWRRQTIEDAGGWEADTLTEDLDLSIRAQLKGWKIEYLEKMGSPAELPAEMNGLKSQQYRWMKGGAETAKKMLPTVWRSDLAMRQKIQATSHLLASSIFVVIFVAGVFSVPLVFAVDLIGFDTRWFSWFLVGWVSIAGIYYVGNVQADLDPGPWWKRFVKFVVLFPIFLALSMGLSLHNTIAVVQGYIGKQSPFVRTPKFAINDIGDTFKKTNYRNYKINWTTVFEGLLAVYFMGGAALGIYLGSTSFVIFHLMLMFGFGTIFYFTLRHLRLK